MFRQSHQPKPMLCDSWLQGNTINTTPVAPNWHRHNKWPFLSQLVNQPSPHSHSPQLLLVQCHCHHQLVLLNPFSQEPQPAREGQVSTRLTLSPGLLLYCTIHNHLQCLLDDVKSAAARIHTHQLLLDACLLGAHLEVHRRQCTHAV